MVGKLTDKIKDVVEDVVDVVEDVVEDVKEAVHIREHKEDEATEEKVKKRSKPAAKRAGMTVKAKKKTAVARAVIKKGNGKITVNNMNLDSYTDGYKLAYIKEPLEIAGDVVDEFDIKIIVKGSGYMSQAVVIRSAIAKAIVRAKGKKYKDLFQSYDRMLLVDDVRKVESKKPLGRKARKKWQSSKR